MPASTSSEYDFLTLEPKWQARWEESRTFQAPDLSPRPKFYLLDMFPYPSGAGLHLGHTENYAATDILGRYKMARGYNVLHPMGWDAFGLPAEQYALKTGTHPAVTTRDNIDNFRTQLRRLGLGLDFSREVNTTDPAYYRWTQWIFLLLFRAGLAYVDERPVNWCPALGTVLANEEVIDGRSEVGGHPVDRRSLRQWVLRITAYADVLLAGLDGLRWPESTKTQQSNWIGRSEGAELRFAVEGHPDRDIVVFTTRPDTLFGATYMVLAPEHPLVDSLTTPAQRHAVDAYRAQAAAKSDLDRAEIAREKTGVFTGSFALNPANGERIPVWIADYVLMGYGTGAIMAVPAHDERDYEFARQYHLPIQRVIEKSHLDRNGGEDTLPYTGPGVLVHSGDYTGLDHETAKRRLTADLAERGLGRPTVQFKLRDWLFSRQRYWGEPFPIVWVDAPAYAAARAAGGEVAAWLPPEPVSYRDASGLEHFALPLPPSQLPVTLPPTNEFKPTGTAEGPLAALPAWNRVWIHAGSGQTAPALAPDGAPLPCPASPGPWFPGLRETNTMPQWAGSCWYYLRYLDPHNPDRFLDPAREAYWGMPDLYMGGAEHAVLHLLYARFWHRFLYDQGFLSHPEPFHYLFHHGIILGEDGEKMSKSRGNVVGPDVFIESHGADTLRLYLMFMGPLEAKKPWSSANIEGVARFLRKIWREYVDRDGRPHPKISGAAPDDPETARLLHETIKKVTEDCENLQFNTAISQLMIFANQLQKASSFTPATARAFLQLLAPFAPHFAEELWEILGQPFSILHSGWPAWDPALLVRATIPIVIQVNGKTRTTLHLSPNLPEPEVLAAASADPKVAPFLAGKSLQRHVFVPGRLLNLVTA